MMYEDLWLTIHKSVCSIKYFRNSERIASGTGFKVRNKLITNNHVIQAPGATSVLLQFVEEDGHTEAASKRLSISEFSSLLRDGSPESEWDFAILDLEFSEFSDIAGLNICASDNSSIGQPIVFFGFQFTQPNLSIHSGILSSKFIKNNVKYLQLDASVNQGNSGGPLINPHTSEVIGIITRKATGLTKQFDELLQSFGQNIQILENAGSSGTIQMFGINPIEYFKVSQSQMAKISKEIRRSANVGIGYAYEIEKMRESFELLD